MSLSLVRKNEDWFSPGEAQMFPTDCVGARLILCLVTFQYHSVRKNRALSIRAYMQPINKGI